MRKTINIAGKDVALKATASTIRKYRAWFGRDLLVDFKKIQKSSVGGADATAEAIEIIEDLTYTMARQADPSIPGDVDDWLDSFDAFPIQDFVIEVVSLWAESLQIEIELKNV